MQLKHFTVVKIFLGRFGLLLYMISRQESFAAFVNPHARSCALLCPDQSWISLLHDWVYCWFLMTVNYKILPVSVCVRLMQQKILLKRTKIFSKILEHHIMFFPLLLFQPKGLGVLAHSPSGSERWAHPVYTKSGFSENEQIFMRFGLAASWQEVRCRQPRITTTTTSGNRFTAISPTQPAVFPLTSTSMDCNQEWPVTHAARGSFVHCVKLERNTTKVIWKHPVLLFLDFILGWTWILRQAT